MPPGPHVKRYVRCHLLALLIAVSFFAASGVPGFAQPITNLRQLTRSLTTSPQTNQSVDLTVTVCAASRPEVGVLIVQDETGVELLQLGNFQQPIEPGEQIRIRHGNCLIRKREIGVELTAMPVGFPPPSTPHAATTPVGKVEKACRKECAARSRVFIAPASRV